MSLQRFLLISIEDIEQSFLTNLGSFAEGLLVILAGENSGLKRCIPIEWKTPPKNGNAEETKQGAQLSSNGGVFKTIVSILKPGINLACKLKSIIMNFLGGKKRRFMRRRNFFIHLDINRHTRIGRKRLFMMLKTKAGKMKLKKWFISSVVNAVSSVAKSAWSGVKAVGSAVVSGAKAVGSAVVKGAKWVGNAILSGAAAIFNGVVNSIKRVWNWFKSFFSSPLFSQIKSFISCMKSGFKAEHLKKAVGGFISSIRELLKGWTGFIRVIVDTVCNWAQFERSVEYLIAATQQTGRTKWLYLGRFMGRMILAIGGLKKKN